MRFSGSGCVEKRELTNPIIPDCMSCGRMMNSCATSSLFTSFSPGFADILRSAEASARGLPHSSAPPASAIYSRLRDMAKRVMRVKK